MARLIVRYPDNRIQEVEFEKPRYTIGSASDNDLVVSHEEVEPHHAEITYEAGAFFIKNLSERENTTVNGKKIDRINLNYGDRIALGPVICLFYPESRKKIGVKPKVFMFIGGGALLVILSIIVVFYITTKRISTVVEEGVEIPEIAKKPTGIEKITSPATVTPGEKKETPSVKKIIPERKVEKPGGEEKLSAEKPLVVPQEAARTEKIGFIKRFFLIHKESVSLPEPTPEEIRSRRAIAVPKGLKRLFFRKIPVVVSSETISKETPKPQPIASGEGGGFAEALPKGTETPVTGITTEIKSGEATLGEVPKGEVIPEEKTSFFTRIFIKPLRRFFGGGKEEGITQPSEVVPEQEGGLAVAPLSPGEVKGAATPTQEETKPKVEKPEEKEVLKLTDPVAYLKSLELEVFKERSFFEEPVYSENEILEFNREKLIGEVNTSEKEDINTGIFWEYPKGETRLAEGVKNHISRTGTIADMNDDKKPDFIFGTKNGTLIVLNGVDGNEILRKSFDAELFEPVYLSDKKLKRIVVSTITGSIESYDSNLNQLWVFKEKNGITTQPLAVDLNNDGIRDLVYSTTNMEVFAIDGRKGLEIWRFFDLESESLWPPVGFDVNDDGVADVLILTRGGILHAIDGKSGWGLWVNQVYGLPTGPPTVFDIDGDRKKEIITLTRRGILSVFNKKGDLLFMHELKRRFRVIPSGGDFDGDKIPEIALVDINGVVTSFEPISRKIDWELEVGDPNIIGRIAVADVNFDGLSDIIFNSLSGVLYTVDGRTGSILAQHNLEDYILSSPIVYDLDGDKIPEIIESTYSGKVIAVKIGEVKSSFWVKIFKKKPEGWASINGNPKNTGYNRYSKISLFGK